MAEEIGVHHLVPQLGSDIRDRHAAQYGGRVDQDVETPLACEKVVDDALALLRAGEVRDRRAAGGERGKPCGVDIDRHDARALRRQQQGRRAPDAGGGAGHDRDLARDSKPATGIVRPVHPCTLPIRRR